MGEPIKEAAAQLRKQMTPEIVEALTDDFHKSEDEEIFERADEKVERQRQRIIQRADERGEFYQGVDGFVYYWPSKDSQGHYAAHHLRWIADELDARNKDWNQMIDNDPTVSQNAKD